MDEERVFQEINVFEILGDIGGLNKALNAKVLTELEKYVKNKEDFQLLRKFILDEQNSYTRSVVRLIFGDIEYSQFSKR
jgi:hypothetical protein